MKAASDMCHSQPRRLWRASPGFSAARGRFGLKLPLRGAMHDRCVQWRGLALRKCRRVSLRYAGLLGAVLLWLAAFGTQSLQAVAETPEPPADALAPQIVAVKAGFEGLFKLGFWTPYQITIRGGARPIVARLDLTVRDGDNVATTIAAPRPLHIPAGDQITVMAYAKTGRDSKWLNVALRSPSQEDDRVLVRQSLQLDETFLPENDRLVVGIGADVGLASVAKLLNRSKSGWYDSLFHAARPASFDELPTRWYGYETVDWLIVSLTDPTLYRGLSASDARFQAIERWVARGGQLLLFVGAEAPEALAPESPWSRFAPGRFQDMVTLGVFTAIEAYSGSSVPVATGRQRTTVEVPRFADVRGVVEAREGNLPLVVRRAYGFGQVVFVGLDLEQPPWLQWPARNRLVARLLGHDVDNLGELDTGSDAWGTMAMAGFDDLSGNLRAVLDQFSGIQIAPFWLIAVLVFAYILWIGPVDYLLVKYVFRRMELTWITFPTAVLLISAGAYGLGRHMKGSALLVNTIDLFDVDIESGLVRGTHWSNIFSPQVDTYTVEVQPLLPDGATPADAERLLSWLGLPGFGIGGMQSPTADAVAWNRGYRYSDALDQLLDVPIQVWSTKSFVQRWSTRRYNHTSALDIELRERDGFLEGRITNRLDIPVEDALLAFGRWAYRLETIAPGQSVAIDPLRDPRTLEAELADLAQATKNSASPMAVRPLFASDPVDLVRQMTFYQAGGGRKLTQLSHRYQSFVDLSAHLKLGRAVLIGFLERPVGQVLVNGNPQKSEHDRHTTCLRVVVPLAETSADGASVGHDSANAALSRAEPLRTPADQTHRDTDVPSIEQ